MTKLKFARITLLIAAIYNLGWGAIIAIYPQILLFGHPPDVYLLILIQCIGMLVGVYGIGYYIASRNPQKYYPLVLVGFIGKVLGPIGAVYNIYKGLLPTSFLLVNLLNDLIWLWPFAWIILQARKGKLEHQ